MPAQALLLPGEPGFYETLHSSLPPGSGLGKGTNAFIVDSQSGLLREARSEKELQDYLYGGEYDLMMAAFGNEEAVIYEEEDWGCLEL